MSAGVERCMAIPSVISRDLLVTNMRGVESAAIAEHAIAFALALARGIDTFVTDKNRGVWSRAGRRDHGNAGAGRQDDARRRPRRHRH